MKEACDYIPNVNAGNESNLYIELLNHLGDSESAQKIWALTKTDEFKELFPDLQHDENGEVLYSDVAALLHIDQIVDSEQAEKNKALDLGIIKSGNTPVTFNMTIDAMRKCAEFNEGAINYTAVIEKSGDKYRTKIVPSSTDTLVEAAKLKRNIALFDTFIPFLEGLGFNVSFSEDPDFQSVFDPANMDKNVEGLKNIITLSNNPDRATDITEETAHFVLAGMNNSDLKKRIDRVFTEEVVKGVLGSDYDTYYNKYRKDKTPVQERLQFEAEGKVLAAMLNRKVAASLTENNTETSGMQVVLEKSKNLFQRLWNAVKRIFGKTSVDDVNYIIHNAEISVSSLADKILDGSIAKELDTDLISKRQKLYNVDAKIEKLASIASEGEAILAKRLSILQSYSIKKSNEDNLEAGIDEIRDQLEQTNYVLACSDIMRTLQSDIDNVYDQIVELRNKFELEADSPYLLQIEEQASVVTNASAIVAGYLPYLQTLKKLPSLVTKKQINMPLEKAEEISNIAKECIISVSDVSSSIEDLRFNVLRQLIKLYYGYNGEKPDNLNEDARYKWESVDMMLSRASDDIKFWDTRYFSAGDSKNTLINVIHYIIKDRQAHRDSIINKYTMRMRAIHKELDDAGHSDDYVYNFDENGVPTGYFTAPVRFEDYEKDYKAFLDDLDGKDLRHKERNQAIKDWRFEHTDKTTIDHLLHNGDDTVIYIPKESIYKNHNFKKGWDAAQEKYYYSMMKLKCELEKGLPLPDNNLFAAPKVRKSISQVFDNSVQDGIRTVFGNIKSKIGVTEDNMDYGNSSTVVIDGVKYKAELQDFNDKKLRRVPVYFVHQFEDPSDLSTDTTHAMFCYIAMAVNYFEMDKINNVMQLMQDHAEQSYQVERTSKGLPIIDTFRQMGKTYSREAIMVANKSNISEAIIQYIDRNMYNETKEMLGYMNNPFNANKQISKDALLNGLLYLTSVSRMGVNPLSGITNVLQGEAQMLGDAAANNNFDLESLKSATATYLALLPEYIENFNRVDRHDKMFMFINAFNATEDFFRDILDTDFNKSAAKRAMGRGNVYFLNTAGEHYLHVTGALAVTKYEKVRRLGNAEGSNANTDEIVSLYDCLKVEQNKYTGAYSLVLDDDIEFVDSSRPYLRKFNFGTGKPAVITRGMEEELFTGLSVYINKINDDMHGGYTEAEKGNDNRKFLARLVLQFRQWMFGQFNKMYSKSHYDAILVNKNQGAYNTLWNALQGDNDTIWEGIIGLIQDAKNVSIKYALEQRNLSDADKKKIGVALSQVALFAFLSVLVSMTAGWKDDDRRMMRLLAYSMARLKLETGAQVPWITFPKNIYTLANSPMAAMDTMETLTTALDMTNLFEEIKSGRYKGWSKGAKAAFSLTPLYNIQKLIDMKDYNYMFNIFN